MIRTRTVAKVLPSLIRASALGLRTTLPGLIALTLPACTPADSGSGSRSRTGADGAKVTEQAEEMWAPGTFPVHIEDVTGKPLIFRSPPTKIVSLVPSATRTFQVLGAQNLLVGRTEHDTGTALGHLPSVGGGLHPSLETLVGLDPDLVVRFAGASDLSTPRRLDGLGIRHLAVRLDRIADVRALIRDLGALTGLPGRAGKLVTEMDSTLNEIRQRVEGRPLVRVAYVLGGNPPWVAGPGTFIDELLTAAGGENSFFDLKDLYGPVSPEEFLVRDIDLLLAPEGGEVLLPSTRVRLVRVSAALELPGPDLAQMAWKLAEILHPEAFQ